MFFLLSLLLLFMVWLQICILLLDMRRLLKKYNCSPSIDLCFPYITLDIKHSSYTIIDHRNLT